MQHVLIIGEESDAHIHMLVPRMQALGAETTIVQPSKFPAHLTSAIELNSKGEATHWLEEEIAPSAVWYRKPQLPVLKGKEIPSVTDFIEHESARYWEAFFASIDNSVRWVNHPFANQQASIKISQLMHAQHVGFEIPDTIVANDPTLAKKFCTNKNWKVIAKTIGPPVFLDDKGKVNNCFARKITQQQESELEHVCACPTILQEYIRPQSEYRVTVIGENVFAFRLNIAGDYVDWRTVDENSVVPESVSLPTNVTNKCVSLVQSFHLNFSSMDLIQSTDGSFYFLDLNPNGQWLWLEEDQESNDTSMSDYFLKFLSEEQEQ